MSEPLEMNVDFEMSDAEMNLETDMNCNIEVPLPIASATRLGGIKVGENLSIAADGTLSAEGSAVVVDNTLTIAGAAADAKKTGDEIGDLKEELDDMISVSYSDNRLDPNSQIAADINTTTGAVTPSDYYSVSGKMPCQYGESLYVVDKANLTNQQYAAIRMAFYTSGDSFIEIQQNVSPFVVPQNAAYCLLRTNKNQIIQEKIGVFPYSGATMSAWIPYAVTKRLSDDYAPSELSNEVANNTAKTAILTAASGENLLKTLKFSQAGENNIISNKFPVKANVTYTLTYSGATDNSATVYVRLYEEGATERSQQISFAFKQGYITFTPQTDIVEAELYFYKPNGFPVETFPFANPCLVYGGQIVEYVPYEEKISAGSIPTMPDIMYNKPSNAIKTLAHMGQSYYFPQNTIWSWLGAKKAGFDYIECDLQVTADNVIVIIHDPDMRRYGGTAQQTVASLTLAQLQTFDAGAWFNKTYEGTSFPVFDDFVGIAKALGIQLALDCKAIDTPAKIDAVADILEKWRMQDEVIWITGLFNDVWERVPNAKILWAAGATLVNGDWANTPGGWFAGFANNFPESKKEQKTITINVSGVPTQITVYVPTEETWVGVSQDYKVADTYGLSDLQLTGQYAKAFGCHFGLYAVDDDDDIFNYVQSIPELDLLTSNRTTVQSASCRKYGIGVSNRPQNIGSVDF